MPRYSGSRVRRTTLLQFSSVSWHMSERKAAIANMSIKHAGKPVSQGQNGLYDGCLVITWAPCFRVTRLYRMSFTMAHIIPALVPLLQGPMTALADCGYTSVALFLESPSADSMLRKTCQ